MSDRPKPAVSLRPFEPGDAAAVHRWFNNPEATRSLMEQRDSFSPEQAEAWVRRAMDDSGEDRKFAIVVEGYAEPVGFTALYGLFRQTAPELGALIGDDVRGKGVGRRAEALTIAKAFDEYGAHRVYGRIPARNEIAKKTVASLGWVYEGTMRAHLRGHGSAPTDDCEVWGVLPDEFRAAAATVAVWVWVSVTGASGEQVRGRGGRREQGRHDRQAHGEPRHPAVAEEEVFGVFLVQRGAIDDEERHEDVEHDDDDVEDFQADVHSRLPILNQCRTEQGTTKAPEHTKAIRSYFSCIWCISWFSCSPQQMSC